MLIQTKRIFPDGCRQANIRAKSLQLVGVQNRAAGKAVRAGPLPQKETTPPFGCGGLAAPGRGTLAPSGATSTRSGLPSEGNSSAGLKKSQFFKGIQLLLPFNEIGGMKANNRRLNP
jgi:hypothetical protein